MLPCKLYQWGSASTHPQPRLSICTSNQVRRLSGEKTPAENRGEVHVSLVRQLSRRDNSNRKQLLCWQAAAFFATNTNGGHLQKKFQWGGNKGTLLGLESPTLTSVVLRSRALRMGSLLVITIDCRSFHVGLKDWGWTKQLLRR